MQEKTQLNEPLLPYLISKLQQNIDDYENILSATSERINRIGGLPDVENQQIPINYEVYDALSVLSQLIDKLSRANLAANDNLDKLRKII